MLGLIFIIIGYVLGSLSSGVLVCKMMGLPDPRTQGSGNPGATNVLRLGGSSAAILVLIGDILKGLIPVLLATALDIHGFMLAMVALAATIGHMFPAFFKFQGGKGVATAFGGILVLSPFIAILAAIVFLVIALITRYVSLGSMVGVVVAAIFVLFIHTDYFLPIAIMAGLIIWRHWDNIQRLQAGTENKIDLDKFRSKKP